MKKRRNAPLPDDVCMCLPELGRVCVWCQNRPAHCPWNPDELPDRLKGYGYRVADQDGYDGEGLVGDRGACLGAGGVEIGDVLDLKKKKRN